MKTVLFLNSPLFIDQTNNSNEDYLPPLGLGIVASAISHKHRVEFLDPIAENFSLAMILEEISCIDPDVICTNIFTTNYSLVKRIVESDSSKHHWIIGGLSTKALVDDIFSWNTFNHIDIVCGDGERIVSDLVDNNVLVHPSKQTSNRKYYLVDRDSPYYVPNLDEEVLDRTIFKSEPYYNVFKELEVSIYASRGCPHNCAFCGAAISQNARFGVRRKSVSKVISELIQINQLNRNVTCIRVLDDLFLADPKSMLDAAAIFDKFQYTWRSMCHIKSLVMAKKDVLVALKNSGCKELFIGIESGSERILKKLHKTDNKEIIMEALHCLFEVGINVKGYFVCGIPTEVEEDLALTLEFAKSIKNYAKEYETEFRVTCFKFRPYCGTELCDEIINSGKATKQAILTGTIESKEETLKKLFSFDSGNYADVTDDVLSEYIKRINNL